MRYCHECNAQFPEEHDKCLHCGRRLRREPPGQPGSRPGAAKPAALRLLADIEFNVVAEGGTKHVDVLQGSYGEHAAIEIYVDSERLGEAEAVLREELDYLTEGLPEPVGSEPDHCLACGSHVPDNAAECPDCGLVFSA